MLPRQLKARSFEQFDHAPRRCAPEPVEISHEGTEGCGGDAVDVFRRTKGQQCFVFIKLRWEGMLEKHAIDGWVSVDNPCIASALEQTPELLPDETVTAIRLGTELGTLSETFAQLLETNEPRADDVQEKWNSVICYLIVLLPTLGIVSLGFCFFIVPTFKRMFDEFELKLPPASLLYLVVADAIAVAFTPCLFLCLVLAALYLFTPLGLLLRRFYRRYLPGAYSARSRRSVLQLLALSQQGNSSLKTAISTLARIHSTPAVRSRFQRADRKIESAGDPWNSLADQHLLSHQQSQSLSAMQESELRNWTLLRLADCKQVAERRRAYTFVSLVQPISILLIALAVLWTCVMCFGPLVSLVTSLT